MGIPVSGLKDDELLHYAGLDPAAAAELARRIAEQGLDPNAEREELRAEIRKLESECDDKEDEAENFQTQARKAADLIRLALNPETPPEQAAKALKEALETLE